jgi:arylsulfatase A-like enzyme
VTLPQLFKNAGIPAVRIGKMYHAGVPLSIGTGSADDFASWDFTFNPRGCDRDDLAKVFSLVPGQFGATVSWLAHPSDDDKHTDGLSAELAVEQLKRFKRENQRFFLAVGFFRPHTPYVAPKKYFTRHPADKVSLPGLTEKDRQRQPPPAYASAKKEQDTMTDAQRREAIQAYHASISFMDAQAGKVLDALRRLGLDRDTVVVFTSDHGYHLGDHGLWQKQSLFERSARVPLIIAAPGAKAAGATAPGVVELLDLYPTLAELCGLKAPEYLDGVSLRPVLENPEARVRPAAFTQVTRNNFQGRSVRTERWRYTEWDEGRKGVELYDYSTDPGESRNLAVENPDQVRAHAELLTRYRRAEPSR